MKYCKNYCEEKEISTSELNEAQRTLYYIAENMKMDKSISEEGYRHFQMAIKALEQELCEDAISRKSLKHKLQENYDFFVNAYGGFSNLPQNDKSRVDEILNCIALVVNEPHVKPQEPTGHWIHRTQDGGCFWEECSVCHTERAFPTKYCPDCGTYMYADIRTDAPTIIEADKAESEEISDRNLKMWHDIYEEEKRKTEGSDKE